MPSPDELNLNTSLEPSFPTIIASTAAATAKVAAGAFFARLGFIDGQRATIEFLAVEVRD